MGHGETHGCGGHNGAWSGTPQVHWGVRGHVWGVVMCQGVGTRGR